MAERTAEFEVEVRLRLDRLEAQLRKGVQRTDRATKQMRKGFDRAEKSIGMMTKAMRRFIGVAAGLAAAQRALSFADAARNLELAAARLGTTVEEMQILEAAAVASNVQFSQLEIGLQRFSRRLQEAARGGGEAAETLERLGILSRTQSGEFETNFQALVAALDESSESATKLAEEFKLVDSEGAKAFGNASEALRAMASGMVEVETLTEDQVSALGRLDQAWDVWLRDWGVNFKRTIADAILALEEFFGFQLGLGIETGGAQSPAALTQQLLGTDQDREKAVQDWETVAERISRDWIEMFGTPAEIITDRYDRLSEELVNLARAGKVAKDEFVEIARQLAQMEDRELADAAESVEDLGTSMEDVAANGIDRLSDALGDLASGGEVSFKRLGQAFASFVAQLVAKQAIVRGLQALGSSVGGGFGAAITSISGALADGGPALAGRSYLVGERGPEIFTPGVSGMVAPNAASGGGANVTVINNTGQPSDTRQGVDGLEVIIGAVADDIGRGGAVAQASQLRFGLTATGRRG